MKKECEYCEGDGLEWTQLTWTHAYSYEDALDKLLKRKHIIYGAEFGMYSPLQSYAYEDKFFLVWAKGASTGPIDVTKAVAYRLHDWQAKEIYKREKSKKTCGYCGFVGIAKGVKGRTHCPHCGLTISPIKEG